MTSTKISGKRLMYISQKGNGFGFISYINHKDMGNTSRQTMNNWHRYYTKRARTQIKNETKKEVDNYFNN